MTHRTVTIIVGLAATLCLAAGVRHLHVEVDPDQQLPQEHPFVQTFHEITRLFGDRNAIVIAVVPTSGRVFEAHFLTKLQTITRDIGDIPGCVHPLLKGLSSPDTHQIFLHDNLLNVRTIATETPSSASELYALEQQVLADPLLANTLVSPDGTSTAIYATFELSPSTPGYVDIYNKVEAVLERNSDGSFTYYIAGPIAVVAALTSYSERALTLFPMALAIIALVHYEAFRTWPSVLLPLLTGLLAVAWAVGIMGYCGISIDPLTATTPVLILAVGAGHAVQILKRYYECYLQHGDSKAAVIDSLIKSAPATIASCLIAALSFASLATLQTDSMRSFGLFTALGIASVLIIELTLMPALRAISQPPISIYGRKRRDARGSHALRRLGYILARRNTSLAVTMAYGAIIATCSLVAPTLPTDSSLIRQFPASAQIRQSDEFINRQFSGASTLLLLIEGDEAGAIATPLAMNALNDLERRVEQLPTVGKALSIVDTLKGLHRAIALSNHAGASVLPESSRLIEQYLLLYSLSGGSDLYTMITPDYRSAKVVLLLRDDSTKLGEHTIASIRALATETLPSSLHVSVAGTVASDIALTEVMVRGKLLNICQVAFITFAVGGVVLRSAIAGLLIAAPLALAVLVNLALMSSLGIPLDVTTAAAAAMAVGLGADYAIYLIFRVREELTRGGHFTDALATSLETSGQAILCVAAAIGLGYAVFCVSGFAIYRNLGLLIGVAMVTSSLASVIVIPAFLVLLPERYRCGQSTSPTPCTRRAVD